MSVDTVQQQLRALSNPATAEHALRFFKTGKGEYGEGDQFLGVRVPAIRSVARQHRQCPLAVILQIIQSPYHEERMLALIMLVYRFSKADAAEQRDIYQAYLGNTRYINGWDLVDSSAHQIVGGYLLDKNRRKLKTLARSQSLWERRIAIIASLHFIKNGQYDDTLALAEQLLSDREDLIHKAAGWMLREVGNRDKAVEQRFLQAHYRAMPRTMLRYAIEKFDPAERRLFLNGEM